jgi:hypothetical protein
MFSKIHFNLTSFIAAGLTLSTIGCGKQSADHYSDRSNAQAQRDNAETAAFSLNSHAVATKAVEESSKAAGFNHVWGVSMFQKRDGRTYFLPSAGQGKSNVFDLAGNIIAPDSEQFRNGRQLSGGVSALPCKSGINGLVPILFLVPPGSNLATYLTTNSAEAESLETLGWRVGYNPFAGCLFANLPGLVSPGGSEAGILEPVQHFYHQRTGNHYFGTEKQSIWMTQTPLGQITALSLRKATSAAIKNAQLGAISETSIIVEKLGIGTKTKVRIKPLNDGSVSCNKFCADTQWHEFSGACLFGKRYDNQEIIQCDKVLGAVNALECTCLE